MIFLALYWVWVSLKSQKCLNLLTPLCKITGYRYCFNILDKWSHITNYQYSPLLNHLNYVKCWEEFWLGLFSWQKRACTVVTCHIRATLECKLNSWDIESCIVDYKSQQIGETRHYLYTGWNHYQFPAPDMWGQGRGRRK